jgi:hypothetical protein
MRIEFAMNGERVMTHKRSTTVFLFLLAVLGLCDIAQANSISPYVYFWPGVISITVIYAFPASVLAAFLERPFLTAAGIKRRTLVLSLRANFYSTLVGVLLIPVGYQALYTIGVLWCVLAFGVSCITEVYYLRRCAHQQFTWRWVVGGNAASSLVLMGVPPIVLWIKHHNQQLVQLIEQYQTWMGWLACGAAVVVFVASLVWRSVVATSPSPVDPDAAVPFSVPREPEGFEADAVTSNATRPAV